MPSTQFGSSFYEKRSVFLGADKVTGEAVALKRINTEEEANGFPITALREVKLLKALHHDNIVQLKEVVTSKGELIVLYLNEWFLGGYLLCKSTASNWMCTVLTTQIVAPDTMLGSLSMCFC